MKSAHFKIPVYFWQLVKEMYRQADLLPLYDPYFPILSIWVIKLFYLIALVSVFKELEAFFSKILDFSILTCITPPLLVCQVGPTPSEVGNHPFIHNIYQNDCTLTFHSSSPCSPRLRNWRMISQTRLRLYERR